MIWSKVFLKFGKGFLVALLVAILQGVYQGLSSFQPAEGIESWIWKATGSAILGVVMAGINMVKHWNDPKPTA